MSIVYEVVDHKAANSCDEEKVCETDAICKNNDELTLCLVKEL